MKSLDQIVAENTKKVINEVLMNKDIEKNMPYKSAEKNVVKINEAQLKNIISKNVKKAINEIGDTPQGRAAMRGVTRRAANAPSSNQFWDRNGFIKGMNRYKNAAGATEKAFSDAYGGGDSFKAGSTAFKYDMDKGCVKAIGFKEDTNEFMFSLGAGGIFPMEKAMNDSRFKTDENTAKAIAAWIKEKMDMSGTQFDFNLYKAATNWETWCNNAQGLNEAKLRKIVSESIKKVIKKK